MYLTQYIFIQKFKRQILDLEQFPFYYLMWILLTVKTVEYTTHEKFENINVKFLLKFHKVFIFFIKSMFSFIINNYISNFWKM